MEKEKTISDVVNVTFTIRFGLLSDFDEAYKAGNYSDRSSALQEAMRDFIYKLRSKGITKR